MSAKKRFFENSIEFFSNDGLSIDGHCASYDSMPFLNSSLQKLRGLSISKLNGHAYSSNDRRKEPSLLKSVLILNAIKTLENFHDDSVFDDSYLLNNFFMERKATESLKEIDLFLDDSNSIIKNVNPSSYKQCSNVDSELSKQNNYSNCNDILWNQLMHGIEYFLSGYNFLTNKKFPNNTKFNSSFNFNGLVDLNINDMLISNIEQEIKDQSLCFTENLIIPSRFIANTSNINLLQNNEYSNKQYQSYYKSNFIKEFEELYSVISNEISNMQYQNGNHLSSIISCCSASSLQNDACSTPQIFSLIACGDRNFTIDITQDGS